MDWVLPPGGGSVIDHRMARCSFRVFNRCWSVYESKERADTDNIL